MVKNILIATGSPRKDGNSIILAQSFARGARSKEHKITVFDSCTNHVKGCIACDMCWSKGDACVFDDGFRKLAPLLPKADVLVLSMPVYWFGFPSQLKAAIDKMYSFNRPNSPVKLGFTESVLLLTAEDTGTAVFAGCIATYKSIMDHLQVTDRGIVAVPEVRDPGDIAGNHALAKAETLGTSL